MSSGSHLMADGHHVLQMREIYDIEKVIQDPPIGDALPDGSSRFVNQERYWDSIYNDQLSHVRETAVQELGADS
jgi:hypothetical protein